MNFWPTFLVLGEYHLIQMVFEGKERDRNYENQHIQ